MNKLSVIILSEQNNKMYQDTNPSLLIDSPILNPLCHDVGLQLWNSSLTYFHQL